MFTVWLLHRESYPVLCKVTICNYLQADQSNVSSMAKYGSKLRYPYVILELTNSWDEDQLSNCERVSLLKTIKSGWANGLTKTCFHCKSCRVYFKLGGSTQPLYNGPFQVYRTYQVHASHRLVHTWILKAAFVGKVGTVYVCLSAWKVTAFYTLLVTISWIPSNNLYHKNIKII